MPLYSTCCPKTTYAEPTWDVRPPGRHRTPAKTHQKNKQLEHELENARGELSLLQAQYERAEKIIHYSTRYGIAANMARSVMDAALKEGIDPELAFRLVRLESEFNPRAVSKVGAVGLTQLMPSTARLFDKGITQERLYDRETNLRIGFRYLRNLLDMFKGDARLALLAYNRGEVAVWRDVRAGVNPGNGYDTHIMKGYKGKAILE
jgi:soluble lytic murein transglycosylase-like protein